METVNDVLFYHAQPFHLLFVEFNCPSLLFEHPFLKVFVHRFVISCGDFIQSRYFSYQGNYGSKFISWRAIAFLQCLISPPYVHRGECGFVALQSFQYFFNHVIRKLTPAERLVIENPVAPYVFFGSGVLYVLHILPSKV
jgi:hypothetical protein